MPSYLMDRCLVLAEGVSGVRAVWAMTGSFLCRHFCTRGWIVGTVPNIIKKHCSNLEISLARFKKRVLLLYYAMIEPTQPKDRTLSYSLDHRDQYPGES